MAAGGAGVSLKAPIAGGRSREPTGLVPKGAEDDSGAAPLAQKGPAGYDEVIRDKP